MSEKADAASPFMMDAALEVTECHFCCSLLIEAVTAVQIQGEGTWAPPLNGRSVNEGAAMLENHYSYVKENDTG